MAGPNGGVWGNEVTVPEGQKLTENTASYVKPAGEAENAKGAENTGGDDTKETPSTEPVVKMPDGTEVPIADYDPYVQQRQELQQRESRVDGMMSVMNGNNGEGTGESTNTEQQSEDVHPLLADNPLLEKIEINDEFMSDEDKANIERHNKLVDYAKSQNQTIVDMESNFNKQLGVLRDEVGGRFVREDIAQATALTGVTEQELVAAGRATGVTDIKTLATIVVGEKAIQAQSEEAAAAAEAQREQEAANITSTSQGNGSGNNGTQQKEGRGVENWRDKESVGAAYKFGAV
ncbi:MAG: hypothetical protein OXH00_02630 [Candidatus Poribacteria bacterium]|nr:hypothetical protein [Candidatus Poribacteria bacterium]